MSNPYAATRRYDPATRPHPLLPSVAPTERLARLGGSDELLAEVRRRWNEATPDERVHASEAVDHLTDDELRAEIEATEAELLAEATGEAEKIVTGTVAVVAEWVGLSKVRATAVLAVEGAAVKPRRTLIDYCERLLAGYDPTL